MIILGISCYYHDSAACLIRDGEIIAAAAEERFSRKKHDNSFPKNAINFCLDEAKVAINEIDFITFYEKPIVKFERMISQHLEYFPKSYKTFIKSAESWVSKKLNLKKILKEELHYHGKLLFVDHHLSHGASAYYLSNFKKAAIVTIDGVGEWATTTIGSGKKNNIVIDKQINFPNSLGLLYSTVTTYLGFSANNSEYKVMGLAAYGDPKKYVKHFKKLVEVFDDGSFKLNMQYFDFGWAEHMPSKKLVDLFGHQIRKREGKIYQYHKDIAAALQLFLEETIFKLLNQTYELYKTPNLCFAGGVALNSVLNGKILQNTKFKKLFIPPDPSDAGGAMGAALYTYFKYDKKPKVKNFTPYLGPSFSWFQIEKILSMNDKIEYKLLNNEELLDRVSDLLINKKVIGWFQGKMEWGPRALGNRSILGAAVSEKMRDIINAKVKKREMFRPFAPVLIEEAVKDFFDSDRELPKSTKYMLMVYPFKNKISKKVPAVVHVNGSGRLQSLIRIDNHLYYDLVKMYGDKTGIPLIINTSFNIRGEPIVCTPLDAINCFLGTDIDYLVIDDFLVSKKDV